KGEKHLCIYSSSIFPGEISCRYCAMPTLNIEQKEAFKAIQKFLQHPAADTFVLKGYAGTGKTFLMQWLANWLKENEQEFRLLASTGRAAAVLRGKTGFVAKTVHSELYQF